MSFKSAFKTIGAGINDLAKLSVRTYTGSLSSNINGPADAMLQNALTSGDAKLVGLTIMNLDGDIEQFMSNDPEISERLHNAHGNAVVAGQQSRQATINLFSAAINNVVSQIRDDN